MGQEKIPEADPETQEEMIAAYVEDERSTHPTKEAILVKASGKVKTVELVKRACSIPNWPDQEKSTLVSRRRMMNDVENNLDSDGGNPDPKKNKSGFGLNKPTGQFTDLDEKMKAQDATSEPNSQSHPNNPDDLKFKSMGWRGIDEEEEEQETEQPLGSDQQEIPEDELDMTPMVDVTFLLLIFFMVTASFMLQSSLEQPHATSDKPTINPQQNDDYIQVNIDQNNTYYVTTRDSEEVECPSESEMRSRVKDAKATSSATRLIIRAHEESLHEKVVTVWDAGLVSNLAQIEIQTTDEDF